VELPALASLVAVLIGGVLVGTLITLLFLPALCTLVLGTATAPARESTTLSLATNESGG
jgi:uncharacterized membrane protein